MRARIFYSLLLILSLLGCDRIGNQADPISVECGIDTRMITHANYVKLLAPSGAAYGPSDGSALQAILRKTDDSTQNLPITPNACVIATEEGIIQALDSRNGASISAPVKKPTAALLQTLQLLPKHPLQLSLACKGEGLFASQTLTQPLILNYAGDPAGLEMRLDAYNSDNNFVKTLFAKTVKESQLNLTDALSLADLDEGVYFLKIYAKHISEGVDSTLHLMNPEQSCRLTILRGQVLIKSTDRPRLVYPVDANLPWAAATTHETLSYCSEEHGGSRIDASASTECQPKGYCRDSSRFKQAIDVKTEKTGIYDYFVFSENRLGVRSPLSCQTVIISNDPPALQVSWQHDDLKLNGAVLRKPYAVLRAAIAVNHNLLSQAQIKQNLQCKVEFEVKGKSTFSDPDVTCLEGRCKGLSLAEYQPCDEQLSFTAIHAMDQAVVQSSRLVLRVRADDGAGHGAEAEAFIWLNQSTWAQETLDLKINNVALDLDSYQVDPSGLPIAIFREGTRQKTVAVFQEGSWKILVPEIPEWMTYKLVPTPDGSIRIVRVGSYTTGFDVQINAYVDGKFVELVPPKPGHYINSCTYFMIGPNDDYWCMGLYVHEIFHLKDGVFQALPSPVQESDPAFNRQMGRRILQDGRLLVYSAHDIFTWSLGNWTRQPLTPVAKLTETYQYDLIEDFKGRLWFYTQPAMDKTSLGLYRLNDGELIPYPASAPNHMADHVPHPASGPGLNSITSGAQRFDFSQDRWTSIGFPLDLAASVLPEATNSSAMPGGASITEIGGAGLLEANGELLYWPLKGLGFRFRDTPIRAGNYLYFSDFRRGAPSLVRIRAYPAAFFDSRMLDIRESAAAGTWRDSRGNTVIALSTAQSSGYFITSAGGNILTRKMPEKLQGTGFMQKLDDHLFCVYKFSGLYLYDDRTDDLRKISDDGYGKVATVSMDTLGHLWIVKNMRLFLWDGREMLDVDSSLHFKEPIVSIKTTVSNERRILVSEGHIFLFDHDLSQAKTYEISEFMDDPTGWKFRIVAELGRQELLVEVEDASWKRIRFILNLATGENEEAKQLKSVIGTSQVYQVHLVGSTVYMSTSNHQATTLKKTSTDWEIISKLDDFKTMFRDRVAPFQWILPEASGRIWTMTLTPMTLGRFDP